MSKKAGYIESMKHQLDELNDKMEALEVASKEAKADARAVYKEEMGKLRAQSKRAVAKYDDLVAAGEDKWEAMTTEMETIRDAFVHSFHYFKSQV